MSKCSKIKENNRKQKD